MAQGAAREAAGREAVEEAQGGQEALLGGSGGPRSACSRCQGTDGVLNRPECGHHVSQDPLSADAAT